MNANESPAFRDWDLALLTANHMASRTGVRRRLRQVGTIWLVHEVDQAAVTRKKESI